MSRFGSWVAVLLAASACSQKRSAPESGPLPLAPSAAPSVPLAAPPPRSTAGAPEPSAATSEGTPELALPTKACRAMAVKGDVQAEGGRKISTGDPLDRPTWLVLGAGSELAVKHAETSRELVFYGPGRVLACDQGEERFLLIRGRAVTATWAGARPGAEVLIATPLGVVLYGDAKLDVSVDDRRLAVRAEVGDAWISTPSSPAEKKVPGGTRSELKGQGVDVKTLLTACERGAEEAESRARAVLTTGSPSPLGERAAAHARARKAARLSCSIAAAAVGTLEMGQDRDDLSHAVSRAETRWRGLPQLRPR